MPRPPPSVPNTALSCERPVREGAREVPLLRVPWGRSEGARQLHPVVRRRHTCHLLPLQLVDQVRNGPVQIARVDGCEKTTEHASAKAFAIQHERHL